MQVSVFVESSTAITFICLKYDGFDIFVALTEKSLLFKTYWKSASSVMLIFVFSVGFADGGFNVSPLFVVVIVVMLSEFVTV